MPVALLCPWGLPAGLRHCCLQTPVFSPLSLWNRWLRLNFCCWVWQVGNGLREHLGEHVGLFLVASSQRDLLSGSLCFWPQFLQTGCTCVSLTVTGAEGGGGGGGRGCCEPVPEFYCLTFLKRVTFYFSHFIFVTPKLLNLKSLGCNWWPAVSTLWTVVALFPCVFVGICFFFI